MNSPILKAIVIAIAIAPSFSFLSMAQARTAQLKCADIFLETAEPVREDDHAKQFLEVARREPMDTILLPRILTNELTNHSKMYYSEGTGRFLTAIYRGQKVFLKSKDRRAARDDERSETVWYQFLNLVHLGPTILGVTAYDGRMYTVTEFVDGVPSKFPYDSPRQFRLTSQMTSEMKRQLGILEAYGVLAVDAQFLIRSSGGIVMIDPDLFIYVPSDRKGIAAYHAQELKMMKRDWEHAGQLARD